VAGDHHPRHGRCRNGPWQQYYNRYSERRELSDCGRVRRQLIFGEAGGRGWPDSWWANETVESAFHLVLFWQADFGRGRGEQIMETVMVISLAVVLATAILTDLHSGLIPNRLTFSAMGLALLVHAWLGGFPGMLFSLAGLGTGFGLFLLLY